jgi:hypothetical protein
MPMEMGSTSATVWLERKVNPRRLPAFEWVLSKHWWGSCYPHDPGAGSAPAIRQQLQPPLRRLQPQPSSVYSVIYAAGAAVQDENFPLMVPTPFAKNTAWMLCKISTGEI